MNSLSEVAMSVMGLKLIVNRLHYARFGKYYSLVRFGFSQAKNWVRSVQFRFSLF